MTTTPNPPDEPGSDPDLRPDIEPDEREQEMPGVDPDWPQTSEEQDDPELPG